MIIFLFKWLPRTLGALLLAGLLALNAPAARADAPPRGTFLKTAGKTTAGSLPNRASSPLRHISTLDLGIQFKTCAALDSTGEYLYCGDYYPDPANLTKVRLADMAIVSTSTLNSGENRLTQVLIDSIHGFAYFVSEASSQAAVIIKVRLADLTRVSTLTLNAGENKITGATIDPAGGYAYFTTGVSGSLVRVRLSDFQRETAMTFATDEGNLKCVVIDPSGGHLYVGADHGLSGLAHVIKVRLVDFQRIDMLTLDHYSDSGTAYGTMIMDAAIDTRAGYAYFTHRADYGGVMFYGPDVVATRIRLSDFSYSGTKFIAHDSDLPYGTITHQATDLSIDSDHGYAYFRLSEVTAMPPLWNATITFEKVSLADFSRLNHGPAGFIPLVDPTNNYAYILESDLDLIDLGAPLAPTTATYANKITLPESAGVRDVRFFSHAAKGMLRLAIYSDTEPRKLLWQSKVDFNTQGGDWVTVPVAQGTPASLNLPAGPYWLAWQSTDPLDVGSCAPALPGTGFAAPWPGGVFGTFPGLLGPGDQQPSATQWSEYLTYEAINAAAGWTRY